MPFWGFFKSKKPRDNKIAGIEEEEDPKTNKKARDRGSRA
jgi:hypothetical protein